MSKGKSLSFIESLVISYVTSLLVTFLFGTNLELLLLVNLILLVSSVCVDIKRKLFLGSLHVVKLNIVEVGILLCAFLLFLLSIASIFSDYLLFIGPDFWRHYGWILNTMKGVPELPLVGRTFHFLYVGCIWK